MRLEPNQRPSQAPINPKTKQPPAAAAPAAQPVDRVVLTGSTKGIPAAKTQVEADLSMVGDSYGLSVNGQFRIDQPVVERLLREGFKGNKKLVDAKVTYVPSENVYVIKGKLEVTGPNLPLKLKLALDVDQNRLTLRFKEIEGLGPNSWYEEKVIKGFAYSLRSQGLSCDDFPAEKKIIFRTNDFLRSAASFPSFAQLNEKTTKLSLKTDAAGNLHFDLQSANQGPTIDKTLASDVAMQLKPDGLRAALANMLAPDYKVDDIKLSAGKVEIQGKARCKDMEAAVSGMKLFGALLGAREAWQGDLSGGQAWVKVNLTMQLSGERLLIKPDIEKALPSLQKALSQRGMPSVMAKDHLSIAIQDIITGGKGHFSYVELNEKGLTAKMHVNADSFMGH